MATAVADLVGDPRCGRAALISGPIVVVGARAPGRRPAPPTAATSRSASSSWSDSCDDDPLGRRARLAVHHQAPAKSPRRRRDRGPRRRGPAKRCCRRARGAAGAAWARPPRRRRSPRRWSRSARSPRCHRRSRARRRRRRRRARAPSAASGTPASDHRVAHALDRQRRVERRLGDHRVAGDQRRRALLDEQLDREVERAGSRRRRPSGSCLVIARSSSVPGLPSVGSTRPLRRRPSVALPRSKRDRPADLEPGLADRLARLACEQIGELIGDSAERVGRALERGGALGHRQASPGPLGDDGRAARHV